MCGIDQESNRRVWRAALRMFFRKAHELISDAPERIELKRMLAWSRFEELVLALLQINRRRTRHVVQVITLAIPRQRRPHRWTIARVVKVIGPGKILCLSKRRRRVAEVWRVIVKKGAAKLARSAASKTDAHSPHRHDRRRLHANQVDTPLSQ